MCAHTKVTMYLRSVPVFIRGKESCLRSSPMSQVASSTVRHVRGRVWLHMCVCDRDDG